MGLGIDATKPTNALSIISLISSILGWVFTIIFICVNFGILPILTIATFGAGLLLYCIVLPFTCITPIGWIIGVVTGHASLSQIRETGAGGEGMAKGGLISGYIGLGLIGLTLCALLGFFLFTGSIPFLIGIENL
ncbi:MAG: DUF4190 domain-containing protein [Chloroflexi bacterium]|nr:DUF4190 domain-containing protein [Chloroflexota bacterium]